MLDLIICLMALKLIYELKNLQFICRLVLLFGSPANYISFRVFTGKFLDYLITQKVYHGLGNIEARYLGMALGALFMFGSYKLVYDRFQNQHPKLKGVSEPEMNNDELLDDQLTL